MSLNWPSLCTNTIIIILLFYLLGIDEFGSCLVALSEDDAVDAADESFCCLPDDDGTQLLLFFDFHSFIFISFILLKLY